MKLIRIIAWVLLATILFVTVDPIAFRPDSGLPVNVERFIAFAVVGVAFACAYPKRWIFVLVLVVGSAFAFELSQMLAPTRHAGTLDAVVKATGGLFGVLAAKAFTRIRNGQAE